MDDPLEIIPADQPLDAVVRPPGSKSITNRALICASVATGRSELAGALASDDTQVMVDSLVKLGVPIEVRKDDTFVVEGCHGGPFPNSNSDLFIGNSGTSVRFLTALLSVVGGQYRIDGVPRMHERPIGDLVEALSRLGCQVKTENGNACPPVIINTARSDGGRTGVRGNVSSQYLSGLLMAAPMAASNVEIKIDGPLVSVPYVEMTLRVMADFGVHVERTPDGYVIEKGQTYSARKYEIEPDASAASYFWAAAAIRGGNVTVRGLNQNSIQGDIAFTDVLERMGCRVVRASDGISVTGRAMKAVSVDMSDISDTVQTLAAVAVHVPGKTTVTGIAHNRVKETDRIGNLAIELRKLGADVVEFEDGLSIECPQLRPAEIETYADHRMAMSLALCGLTQSGVRIRDPACVSKTYPQYFDDLRMVSNRE